MLKFLIPIFTVLVIIPFNASAQVLLTQITSESDLIGGPNAEGQIGDYLFKNDNIAVIVSDINHPVYYHNTGGHIIDADNINGSGDLLNSIFAYLDNTFSYQDNYNQAVIINDGYNGQPAVLRLTGVYSENNQVDIITDYSFVNDSYYIKIQTWLVNNSGSPINNFGLGDAVQWGGTYHFAPGYGFNINGITTTEEWLAGNSEGVSYGYTPPSGTMTGPNGGSWSDPVLFNADIPVGDSVSYIRYLTVGNGDIASAVDIVYILRNESTGLLNGQVVDSDTHEGIDGITIDVSTTTIEPLSQIQTDNNGEFHANLTGDNYHLIISHYSYAGEEVDTIVNVGDTTTLYIELDASSNGEHPLGDTLTYILRPILSVPAIVPVDSTFTIEVDADQSTTGWIAGLLFESLNFDLTIHSSSYDTSLERWFLEVSLPNGIPFELYDLWVTAQDLADTAQNAVSVIEGFKGSFYFIQITDTHMPTHIYHDEPGGLTDTASLTDLWTLIEDFKVINPEFVLLTGDVVNEGELEDYLGLRCYSRSKRLISEFSVPVYVGGGNHDLGGWSDTPPPDGTSRRDWWRFFGWKYLDHTSGSEPYTQDYYFDYGNLRFIELEAYLNYDSWRYNIYGGESFTDMQMSWLGDVISETDPSKGIVTFNHCDFQDELNLTVLGIDMNLYGHIHRDDGLIDNYPYDLATNNVCDGERSFRVVHYDTSGLRPLNTFSSGSSGENLTIVYSPENNGTNDEVTATITNNYSSSFHNGLAVFNMPIADSFSVDNGIIYQTIELDSTELCYVRLYIPENSQTSVTITAVSYSLDCSSIIINPHVPSIDGDIYFDLTVTNTGISVYSTVYGELYPTIGDCASGTVYDFDINRLITTNLAPGASYTGHYYYHIEDVSSLGLSLCALNIDVGLAIDNWSANCCDEFTFYNPWGRVISPLAKWGNRWLEEEFGTETVLPKDFALYQNYPNPFNSITNIRYSLPQKSDVHLEIYDVLGRSVDTLINKMQEPGIYTINWDASEYPSGIYFYKLTAGMNIMTKRLVLLK